MKEKRREPGKRDFLWFHRVFRWEAIFYIKTARGHACSISLLSLLVRSGPSARGISSKIEFPCAFVRGVYRDSSDFAALIYPRTWRARRASNLICALRARPSSGGIREKRSARPENCKTKPAGVEDATVVGDKRVRVIGGNTPRRHIEARVRYS